ncbi:MAG: holdfast anchor protein HfaD [Hyphomonadaceae bacterium]
MSKLTATLLGAAAILAVSPQALAQQSQTIDQVNLGNVWSSIDVKVDWAETRVDAVGASVGNSLTGLSDGPISAKVTQDNYGAVETESYVWTGEVGKEVTSTSSAIANTSVIAGQNGDVFANVEQTSSGNVQAINQLDAELTWATTNQTTAASNVSEVIAADGEITTFQEQHANGSVLAYSNSIVPDVDGFATNISTAAGNSATNLNSNSEDAFNGAVQTTAANTNITAIADADIGQTQDINNIASAAGNQLTAENVNSIVDLGSEGSETFQGNDANIEADAFTQATVFSGIANTSANGVGNSVSTYSLGGSTELANIQNNTGNVDSTVTLNATGFNGGAGVTTSSAIGNSISATAENGSLSSTTRQFNSGNTTARTNVNGAHIGSATSSATAIGNAATFSTRANAGS